MTIRRAVALGAGLAGLAALASSGLGACGGTPRVRNVILISIDTLRADHLGSYGYARDTSPRLDELAASGVVFERAIAHAPNTAPSHASLLTSLYPGRHGFTGDDDRLASAHTTLAELVGAAGLRTAAFVDNGYLSRVFGFEQGFDVYDDAGGGLAGILPRAEAWLDANGDAAFFLFLHTYDTHTPYDPPEPYRDLFHDRPYRGHIAPTTATLLAAAFHGLDLAGEDLRHVVARYDEGIRYVDAELAGFLSAARRKGLLDDSVVVVTSDHGEEFGDHGSFDHWQLHYAAVLRVPLIIALPDGAHAGRRIGVPVQLVDVVPTLLELLDLTPHPEAQGESLAPLLRKGDPAAGDPLWRRAIPAWPPSPGEMRIRSLTTRRYHLRFDDAARPRPRLFDLEADPLARTNIAGRDSETTRRLVARGLELMRENRPVATEPAEIDASMTERLRKLGYLDARP